MSMDVPVVLIIFRRPAETQRVFQAIRRAKPQRLYIVGDTARAGSTAEAEAVEACRSIVQEVDWACEVFSNFSTENLGLRERVVSGLDWVFSHEQQAIILEDDCLPNDSFFELTAELLAKYANDERIGGIGGTNIGTKLPPDDYTYLFSQYPVIWGWATWRRVWVDYRADIPLVSQSTISNYKLFSPSRETSGYWARRFREVSLRRIDTWDYQLSYLSMIRGFLWVVPAKNLITNIGFGPTATHTWNANSPYSSLGTDNIQKPYRHPASVAPNDKFDQWLRRTMHREGSVHQLAAIVLSRLPETIRALIVRMVLGRRNRGEVID